MLKRSFLAAATVATAVVFAAGCTTTNGNMTDNPQLKRQSIDANVDTALSKLYAQAPGSKELVSKASGMLVFPSVVSAGFVVGGSYGQGALIEGSRTTGYYSTTAASVGLLAGADSKALYILFMDSEALNKFKTSKGWTAGADANVTALKFGANGNIDTQSIKSSVVSFTISNGGLMANLSVDGTKVTKLNL